MTIMFKVVGTLLTILPVLFPIAGACSFTITNDCPYTIWPGILAGVGSLELPSTGFQLDSGTSNKVVVTPGWSGRIWGRTGCNFDGEGNGVCRTGDCGGSLQCSGRGAQPPATLFEITFAKGGDDDDFYDVSLVDGYNLTMAALPDREGCNATSCATNLNSVCPKELQVVDGDDVVACKSACGAFGLDQYCCSGIFASPTVCKPNYSSALFKNACPSAYSYAFDDGTSTFTCKSLAYTITFCPNLDV